MQWPRLDQLDDNLVTQAYEYVVQLIRERHPEADPSRGLLGSFVSELHAVLQGSTRTVIRDVENSLSLKAVMAMPDQAKAELVDRLVSNVGATRSFVKKATGHVRYVLSRPVRVRIVRGEVLRTQGGVFLADKAMVFKEPGVPLRNYDEQHLQPIGNNQLVLTFPVTARDGGGPTPRRAEPFAPHIPPPGLIEAYAADDFTGSFVNQSDTDVVRTIRLGLTAAGFSGRDNIEAMIRKADPEKWRFAADLDKLEIIGAGDPDGKPGQITLRVSAKPDVTLETLVSDLQTFLNEPVRACLSAKVVVEPLDA